MKLDQITSESQIVLFDTSALNWPFDRNESVDQKIRNCEQKIESIRFIREYIIDSNNVYVTPMTLEKLYGMNDYRYDPKGSRNIHGMPLNLRRKIKAVCRIRNTLAETLGLNERVLDLNEEERCLYQYFSLKCNSFKVRRDMTDVQYDFLITGAVASVNRKKTSLISDNYASVKLWKELLNGGFVRSKKLGLYLRRNVNDFEKKAA